MKARKVIVREVSAKKIASKGLGVQIPEKLLRMLFVTPMSSIMAAISEVGKIVAVGK